MRIFQSELLFANNMFNLDWKQTGLFDGIVVFDDVLNKYYAYGSQDTSSSLTGYLRTSNDGIIWEDYGGLDNIFRTTVVDIAAGFYNGTRRFVAVGYGYGTDPTGVYVSTSSDFINWTTPTKNTNLTNAGTPISIAYLGSTTGGRFEIILSEGSGDYLKSNYSYSTNGGSTWSTKDTVYGLGTDVKSIRCYPFYVFSFDTDTFYYICSDGRIFDSPVSAPVGTLPNPSNNIEWTDLTLLNDFWLAVGENNGEHYYTISFDFGAWNAKWTDPIRNDALCNKLVKSNNKIINYFDVPKRSAQDKTPLYLSF